MPASQSREERKLERISKAISAEAPWPAFVDYFKIGLGEDDSGEEIVVITVVVIDNAPNRADWAAKRVALRHRIRRALEDHNIEQWAVVYFRTKSEEEEDDDMEEAEDDE